jgi:uncharacterized Zn-finger protein
MQEKPHRFYEEAFGENGFAKEWLTQNLSRPSEDISRHLSFDSIDDFLALNSEQSTASGDFQCTGYGQFVEDTPSFNRFAQRSSSLSPLTLASLNTTKRANSYLGGIQEERYLTFNSASFSQSSVSLTEGAENGFENVVTPSHIDPFQHASDKNHNLQYDDCDQHEEDPLLSETMDRRHSIVGIQQTFACSWPGCHRFFSRAYNLRSHYLIHSGGKPFICGKCGLSFARNHDMRRHIRIHSGEKPYSCSRCLKGFSRRDALDRHRRSSTRCNSNPSVVTSYGSP